VVDIATISALGMYYNLWAESSKMFTTSIYEIDRVLKEWQELELYNIKEETED
jgi:hypothetical protein